MLCPWLEGCLLGGGQRRHYESVRERWKIDIIQEMILVKQGVIFMDKKMSGSMGSGVDF